MDGITITITGRDAQEIRNTIGNLFGVPASAPEVLPVVKTKHLAAPPADNDHVAEGCEKFGEAANAEEKTKRTRGPNKKKEEVKVEAPVPPSVSMPVSEEATLDNSRNWIKYVAAVRNMEAAQSVLVSFGVARLGELPESKFPDFIKECKKSALAATTEAEKDPF